MLPCLDFACACAHLPSIVRHHSYLAAKTDFLLLHRSSGHLDTLDHSAMVLSRSTHAPTQAFAVPPNFAEILSGVHEATFFAPATTVSCSYLAPRHLASTESFKILKAARPPSTASASHSPPLSPQSMRSVGFAVTSSHTQARPPTSPLNASTDNLMLKTMRSAPETPQLQHMGDEGLRRFLDGTLAVPRSRLHMPELTGRVLQPLAAQSASGSGNANVHGSRSSAVSEDGCIEAEGAPAYSRSTGTASVCASMAESRARRKVSMQPFTSGGEGGRALSRSMGKSFLASFVEQKQGEVRCTCSGMVVAVISAAQCTMHEA